MGRTTISLPPLGRSVFGSLSNSFGQELVRAIVGVLKTGAARRRLHQLRSAASPDRRGCACSPGQG